MIQVATKYRSKVHGFAMTKPEPLLKAPFYTVDSTRWLTGEQYGCLFIWDRTHLIELRKDDKAYRKRYKRYFENLGLSWELIEQENVVEIGKANVMAWLKCEEFINKRTAGRQWWNDPEAPDAVAKFDKKDQLNTVPDTSDQLDPPPDPLKKPAEWVPIGEMVKAEEKKAEEKPAEEDIGKVLAKTKTGYASPPIVLGKGFPGEVGAHQLPIPCDDGRNIRDRQFPFVTPLTTTRFRMRQNRDHGAQVAPLQFNQHFVRDFGPGSDAPARPAWTRRATTPAPRRRSRSRR